MAALLLGSLVQVGAAEAGAKIPSTVPYFGLYLNEAFDLNIEPDNFWANADSADHSKILRCSGLDDPICTNATNIKTIHNLPACSVDASFDCIKSVWAIDSAGKKIEGQFLNSLPVKGTTDRAAIPEMLLSAANGFGGLWKIPGAVNGGGEENYFVSMRIDSYANKSAGALLNSTKFYYGQVLAGIIPVKPVAGSYVPMNFRPSWNGSASPVANSGPSYTPQGERCTVVDTGVCQLPQDFPAGYRFGMSVQLAQKVSGWFHGRIALPQIEITQKGAGQLVNIEAEPVKVSTLDFTIPNAQIPDSVRKVIFDGSDWGVMGAPNGGIQTMLNGLSNPQTMQIMNEMLPTIGDKASKTTQYWSYRALNTWQNPEIEKCTKSKDELGGVVTTNALTYGDGPPTFNKSTGSLEYRVASPHFEANGAVASGTYDLAINSVVARCIYGFSSAPIQAEISITTSDGEKKVATTIVNEKNGWLYLSAKGFTFSSPTIKVKLSQEKEVVVAPTPSPTPVATVTVAKKSITITCVKGKATKKVTGTSPKCPTGYKKK